MVAHEASGGSADQNDAKQARWARKVVQRMADRKLLTETRLRRRMKRTTKHGKKGLSMHSFLVRWSGAPFACTQRKALGSTVRLDIEAPCTLSVGCSTSPAGCCANVVPGICERGFLLSLTVLLLSQPVLAARARRLHGLSRTWSVFHPLAAAREHRPAGRHAKNATL